MVDDDRAIATDPINAMAVAALLGEIKRVADRLLEHLFCGSVHPNHLTGAKVIKETGVKIVALANSAAEVRRMASPNVAMPDEPYDGPNHTISLGGRISEPHDFGRNPGNCMSVTLLKKKELAYIAEIVTPTRALVGTRRISTRSPGFVPYARSRR